MISGNKTGNCLGCQNEVTYYPAEDKSAHWICGRCARQATAIPLTWDLLKRIEPLLNNLEGAALSAGRVPEGERFCANVVWYGALKPLMREFVGHSRGDIRMAEDPFRKPAVMSMDDMPRVLSIVDHWNAWETVMRSSAAYDLAYDYLYDLLPDCRDCTCVGIAT